MARTRSGVDRHVKVDEIVTAAAANLRDGGYEALSVAAIARDLGMAQSSIYHYFPTRDHLFVAALRRLEADIRLERRKVGRLETVDALLWLVDRLSALGDVNAAIYERARRSGVVADYLQAFQETAKEAIIRLLKRDGYHDTTVDDAAEVLLLLIDGMFLRNIPRGERARVLRLGLEALQSIGNGRPPSAMPTQD